MASSQSSDLKQTTQPAEDTANAATKDSGGLNLGNLFAAEEDLIGKIASFCDPKTLGRLSQVSRSCNTRCQARLEKVKAQLKVLKPRETGKCKVYWKTEHSGDAEWIGGHEEGREWLEVETVEDYLKEKLEDLHACDIVQLGDYRGLYAYCAAVREGRLVLIKTGSEYGYMLPPDAYAAGSKYGYMNYYNVDYILGYGGFIFYAELPDSSALFEKFKEHRPSPDHHLYMNFLGEDPESYEGLPSEDDDEEPLYWATREEVLANW